MRIETISICIMLILSSCTTFSNDSPITSNGPAFQGIEKANKILLEFQNKYDLPGISIAISYNNKLVYSASCGYADSENKIQLTPLHRMRIASVTKPITSIAIMKLYENGQLKLDDQVFGKNSILGFEYGLPVYDGKPAKVTVRNLLSHTAGGWGNSENDPMFMITDLNGKKLIEKVLKDYPLKNQPGSKYDYSNFGYCILGRVIEKISGKSYEEYVKENILNPSGITGMKIGSDSATENEVKYYGSDSQDPYVLSPLHMDSHGGWIANPVELLKILSRIDQFNNANSILSDDTIKIMTTGSDREKSYALGFNVNDFNNWWHMGTLPGTSSEIGRASNGFCWAILVNYRPESAKQNIYMDDLDQLFWKIKSEINNWPAGNKL